MKSPLCHVLAGLTLFPFTVTATPANGAVEPTLRGPRVIRLSIGNSLEKWKVPSDRWSIVNGVITGNTRGEKLAQPEWLYTRQKFSNFIFTAELKLSDGPRANSGIYYRVKPFHFKRGRVGTGYEAPSGYEYDAAMGGKHNGTLGDWYARPSLRIYPDREVMNKVFKMGDWNRMTIRAVGNRLEYWLNGVKIMDYMDHDPKRSRVGFIGLQIHDKLLMKVQVRHASVLPLD